MHPLKDPALPALDAALDTERMRARIAHAAGLPPDAVAGCAIERVKYRPGRSALVLYRLCVEGSVPEALVYATVYPSEIRLRAFPEDRKLPGLRLLADPARLRAQLQAQECTLARVSYFPEHAYTARVTVNGGEGRGQTLYAKTQFTARGERTFAAMKQLERIRGHRGDGPRFARPVLYHAASATLFQEAVVGITAESFAVQGLFSGALPARVGAGVAALHGSELDGLGEVDPGTCLRRLHEAVRVFGMVAPQAAARAREVVARLEKRVPKPLPGATLHGDLHLNNILVDAGRVALVDLDDLCHGPAELELGSFAAALLYRAVLHGERHLHRDTFERFLQGYADQARRPVRLDDITWYAAAALVHERAWRCLTSLKPGRLAVMDELLGLAHELAGDPCLI